MRVKVSCPTRVDLAGGTLDLWPIYSFLGGARTINFAIDIFTSAELESAEDYILTNTNLNKTKTYKSLQELIEDRDPDFLLLRKHIAYWKPRYGFSLKTSSDSPIGGGLGGSSSLSVAISRAFLEFTNTEYVNDLHFVNLISNIEAQVLRAVPGTQDYVPPILGGLLSLNYAMDQIDYEKLSSKPHFLEEMMLIYTGKPHHSGLNNFEILSNCISGKEETLTSISELKEISEAMYVDIKSDNDSNIPEYFEREYQCRSRISTSFISEEIAQLKAMTKSLASLKICGAGGGGCVLLLPKKGGKQEVLSALEDSPFRVLASQFCNKGVVVEKN